MPYLDVKNVQCKTLFLKTRKKIGIKMAIRKIIAETRTKIYLKIQALTYKDIFKQMVDIALKLSRGQT